MFRGDRIRWPFARRFLKDFGYLAGVPNRRLGFLDGGASEVTDAARRMQNLYGLVPDGIIGDKTLAAMQLPRCGHPDYPDDELPQGTFAAGSGSWPTSCHETGIKVHIDVGNKPSFVDADATFAASAVEYAKVGVRLVRVQSSSGANIRQSWRVLSGSTIGLAEFNNRSCSDSVFNYRDPGYRGSASSLQNLDLHELGHNHNLEHTSGGIMNPSINESRNAWVEFDSAGRITYQDVSYPTLARYFGGKPLDPAPGPGPDPKPPPDPEPCLDLCRSILKLIQ